MIKCQLELRISDEVHLLTAGASFYIPSKFPHACRNPGTAPMLVVWINTSPKF